MPSASGDFVKAQSSRLVLWCLECAATLQERISTILLADLVRADLNCRFGRVIRVDTAANSRYDPTSRIFCTVMNVRFANANVQLSRKSLSIKIKHRKVSRSRRQALSAILYSLAEPGYFWFVFPALLAQEPKL